VYQVGDQPRLYYDAQSTNHQHIDCRLCSVVMCRSSTTSTVVANAAQKTLSQLRRALPVRCFHKPTYVFFFFDFNQNRNMSPDISRNSKHKIKKKSFGGSHSLYHTDRRRNVTSLMVTFRNCYVKAPKIRFLVTGSFVLAMVQLCFFLLSDLFIYLLIQNKYWGAIQRVDNPSFLLVTYKKR
jgi:hypothetical protein